MTPSQNSRKEWNGAPVLVVGLGPIGIEYARILKEHRRGVVAVGRSADGCRKFTTQLGIEALCGGVEALPPTYTLPERAIVAVSEGQLGSVALQLLDRGVKSILIEKPGGASAQEIRAVAARAAQVCADVYVGYNRRFYASTIRALEIIAEDGGVTSATFEFTEWSHRIEPLVKEEGVKSRWFLHNSTHVVDLAFHLAGRPVEVATFRDGSLSWHTPARYAGCGRTDRGALFAYFADWAAPGRWGVEVLTRRRRLILRPLERLQCQPLGSVSIEFEEIDDALDRIYKPGLCRQTDAFLHIPQSLLTIARQAENLSVYSRINGDD